MIGLNISIALVAATILAAAYRMARGPSDADRAIAADLLFFAVIALIALIGVQIGSSATFDVLIIATLVGFLSAVSLALAIMKGRR